MDPPWQTKNRPTAASLIIHVSIQICFLLPLHWWSILIAMLCHFLEDSTLDSDGSFDRRIGIISYQMYIVVFESRKLLPNPVELKGWEVTRLAA